MSAPDKAPKNIRILSEDIRMSSSIGSLKTETKNAICSGKWVCKCKLCPNQTEQNQLESHQL